MIGANHVVYAGVMIRGPELKYASTGRPFCRVPVLAERRYKDRDGKPHTSKTIVQVCIWGGSAQLLAQYGEKMDAILVSGELCSREYTTEQGEKRYDIQIDAAKFDFLNTKAQKEAIRYLRKKREKETEKAESA